MTSASATLATLGLKELSPAEIDRLAAEFLELEARVDRAYEIAQEFDTPHEALKEKLVDLVETFGGAHAEKSQILRGLEYELMATFSMSTSVDAAAVHRFAQALQIAKQTRLINKLFEQNIRYTLVPEASSIVRSVALSKQLLALYAQCSITKPRTPTLKVRRIVSG